MSQSISHSIQEILLQSVIPSFGDIHDIRLSIKRGDHNSMKSIISKVDDIFDEVLIEYANHIDAEDRQILLLATAEPIFCQRVKEGVFEAIYSERLCPPLDILAGAMPSDFSRHPYSINSGDANIPVHAVCIEYLPNICNEIYPLMVDSYVCDLAKHWRQRRLVIGIHADWLDENLHAKRCIYNISDSEQLIESSFTDPIRIDSVHFLAVSPEFHQLWSERFAKNDIHQVNPYQSALKADDKFSCYCQLNNLSVPSPKASLIKQSEISTLDDQALIDRCNTIFSSIFENEADQEITLVVQPNKGTEGRGVKTFSGPLNWSAFLATHPELPDYIKEIARNDDVLLRRGIQNVKILDDLTDKAVFFDIRVNVINGRMESGFLMLAPPDAVIASPEQGGHVLECKIGAQWMLSAPEHAAPFKWDQTLWTEIQNVAQKTALPFIDCGVVGIDIRLEWRNHRIVAWVLDINPRPAGLAHSRYFETREPGVSQCLWDTLPQQGNLSAFR